MEQIKYCVYNFETGELEFLNTEQEAAVRFFDIAMRYVGPLVHYNVFQKVVVNPDGSETWSSSAGDILEYNRSLEALKDEHNKLTERIERAFIPSVEII